MELSQVNVTPLSPDNLPANLDFLPVPFDSSIEKMSFFKTSANLSILYNIPVRVIFNSNKGFKSIDGIIQSSASDIIQIHQISIPFTSISDIQF